MDVQQDSGDTTAHQHCRTHCKAGIAHAVHPKAWEKRQAVEGSGKRWLASQRKPAAGDSESQPQTVLQAPLGLLADLAPSCTKKLETARLQPLSRELKLISRYHRNSLLGDRAALHRHPHAPARACNTAGSSYPAASTRRRAARLAQPSQQICHQQLLEHRENPVSPSGDRHGDGVSGGRTGDSKQDPLLEEQRCPGGQA